MADKLNIIASADGDLKITDINNLLASIDDTTCKCPNFKRDVFDVLLGVYQSCPKQKKSQISLSIIKKFDDELKKNHEEDDEDHDLKDEKSFNKLILSEISKDCFLKAFLSELLSFYEDNNNIIISHSDKLDEYVKELMDVGKFKSIMFLLDRYHDFFNFNSSIAMNAKSKYLVYAFACYDVKRYKDCIFYLIKLIDLTQNQASEFDINANQIAHEQLCEIYFHLQEYQNAYDVSIKILKKQPNNPQAVERYYQAMLAKDLGGFDKIEKASRQECFYGKRSDDFLKFCLKINSYTGYLYLYNCRYNSSYFPNDPELMNISQDELDRKMAKEVYGYLEYFFASGERSDDFLIQYSAIMGASGKYEKIPQLLWQTAKDPVKSHWKLHMHLLQSYISINDVDKASLLAESFVSRKDVPKETIDYCKSLLDFD